MTSSAIAYLDTEFDAPTDTLLSLALVLDDASECYLVLADQAEDPWVRENVLPRLGRAPIGRILAQQHLRHFMRPYDSLHIVADWPQDLAYLCELFITGPGEAMPTPRLTFEWARNLDTAASAVPHNALADAHALREMDQGSC